MCLACSFSRRKWWKHTNIILWNMEGIIPFLCVNGYERHFVLIKTRDSFYKFYWYIWLFFSLHFNNSQLTYSLSHIRTFQRKISVCIPFTIAISPSGCAILWKAVGDTAMGWGKWWPNMVVDVSLLLTSLISLGRNRNLKKKTLYVYTPGFSSRLKLGYLLLQLATRIPSSALYMHVQHHNGKNS